MSAAPDAEAASSETEGAGTDEVSGVEQTIDASDLGPLASPSQDFEHRRAVASARMRLFGEGPELRIGRFPIQSRLGAGGMGEVYLGRDPELGRPVAIKRVLPDRASARDEARLRREAQALAHLNHPNVVGVYDIGEHGGRLHVVMEYVAGQTLQAWLADREAASDWRAVLDLFLAAGRGLAAAHRAGIVHRDFKPDNVLIGEDGQVRVADFGLAFAPSPAGRAEASASHGGAGSSLAQSMVSSVVGTIRFMPLEQLRGERVDARSDQFAYCVALYEALWDDQPYALTTVHARLDALEARGLERPARGSVPRPIWRAIERGLAVARDDRWPDMDALLDALERGMRWRRRLALGSAAAALVAGLGVAGAVLADDGPSCAPSVIASELDGVWDGGRRASLGARVATLDAAHAPASYARVVVQLDGWAEDWITARVGACEASEARTRDRSLAHAQAACLARQRREVEGFVEILDSEAFDEQTLAAALDASARLPEPRSCDAELVAELAPPPAAIEAEVEALRTEVGRARSLRLLARHREGRELAEAALASASALGYGPLEAEAAAERAKHELVDGDVARGIEGLLDAIDLAEAHRHDRLAAQLWTLASIWTLGERGELSLGRERLRRARASWRRVEPDPRYAAMLHDAIAKRDLLTGDHAAAAAELERALTVLDGDDAPERCEYVSSLAWIDEQRGASQRARDGYAQALACADRIWGPDHPQSAVHAYNLAITLEGSGQRDEAYALFERAANTWTVGHERPHQSWADAELSLANLALARGELDEAARHAEALAAIQDQLLAAADPERAYPAMVRASIAAVREQRERALDHVGEALALLEPAVAADDPRLVQMRVEQATNLLALDRLAEAESSYAAVLAPALGASAEVRVQAYLGLAEIGLRLDQPAAAARALAQLDGEDYAAHEIGAYALPRALLVALTRLRRGADDSPAATAALREAWTDTPFTPAQLETWFEDLGLTPSERARLLPPG